MQSADKRDTETHIHEAAALRTLNAFAIDLIAIPNIDDLFWYVAKKVVGHLNFVDCVIYQADDSQTILTQVAALGEKNPYGRSIVNPLKIPFGEGITGHVAQTKQPVIVDDLLKNQNYIPDTQPARSEICVPLIIRGNVVGVIDSEHPMPGAFGEAELEVLTTIAAMTSAKLELLAEVARSTVQYHTLVQAHASLHAETVSRKALEAELFAARKLESVGRLTGRFAHDFNNLLTVISGNLEFIEAEIISPDAKECYAEARSAANQGAKLIRDMLAFAQRTRLEPQVVDFNLLVTDACDHSKQVLNGWLDVDLDPDLWSVKTDPKLAQEAIQNLISNARDAAPKGEKPIVSTQNVQHSWADAEKRGCKLTPGPYVRVSVKDFGSGIAKHILPQIFDPFFTTKPEGSGKGLGLSMVMGFMQQTGGGVAVESAVGHGATFHLYFPAIASTRNDLLTMKR
ncbi:ATP-binding protein [Pseudorhodobacter sp. W20_MBD10_FR17]|uniref:ATP-binding protein n=1 Tax=Pseudorhodobacter sp. W20_MBD10_FR17 TaxID=3240266 RepID=UPI003F9674C7